MSALKPCNTHTQTHTHTSYPKDRPSASVFVRWSSDQHLTALCKLMNLSLAKNHNHTHRKYISTHTLSSRLSSAFSLTLSLSFSAHSKAQACNRVCCVHMCWCHHCEHVRYFPHGSSVSQWFLDVLHWSFYLSVKGSGCHAVFHLGVQNDVIQCCSRPAENVIHWFRQKS